MKPFGAIFFAWVSLFSALSCQAESVDRTTAEGAFAGLAVCLESSSDGCLLHGLDKDSRDAVWAMFAMTREIRTLVSTHYPDAKKNGSTLPAGLSELVRSESAEGLFAIYCGRIRCAEPLRRTFGAIAGKRVRSADEVSLSTVRGGVFQMRQSGGEWGFSGFCEGLQSERDRVRRNLAEVRKNATAYDEQRQAAGTP